MNEVVPPLTDKSMVVNGSVNVRLTNPDLYRNAMLSGVVSLLMGLNFLLGAIPGGIIPAPTFFVYDQSNFLWAGCFFALAALKLVTLTLRHNDRLLRLWLWLSSVYLVFFALGTCQPFADGKGSLQLPLLYATWAFVCLYTLLNPLINPWTARR